MNKLKHYFLLLAALVCGNLYVGAQYADQMMDYTEVFPSARIYIDYNETLNVNQYRNKFRGSELNYSFTAGNGTQIQVKGYRNSPTYEVYERPPFPAIYVVYKEFFTNGRLKQKGVFLPMQMKIGKWFETDEAGNGFIIDYEAGRNIFGYNHALQYLQQKGYYHSSDGNQYALTFWHTPENQQWGVRVDRNGQPFKTFTFDSAGSGAVSETDMVRPTLSVPVYGDFIQEE